ncbi:HPr family phosphocarrier protein [Dinghuibacter silviterrae]|uniref:Phosphocarrier protein n=1 Tax=Dinghuibacter silviterrae TaxID=1539049 RepID=A0A4R8DI95_9BACT|nr:HPr family phosphocarrier protein [Dinghuibacter silviterrae]TDW97459.1 phosphocarrier protein [Dinghuibacter silviterrae]
MIAKEYVISAPEGIHARPATGLVRLAKQFQSVINLKKGDRIVRLNSLLNILSLAAKGGETITLLIEGEDEETAASALDKFFADI